MAWASGQRRERESEGDDTHICGSERHTAVFVWLKAHGDFSDRMNGLVRTTDDMAAPALG